jgi:hypothetical protein
MKKFINEEYEASANELQEALFADRYEKEVPAEKKAIIESIGSLLEQSEVVLTCPESSYALMASSDTNKKVFRSLGEAAVSAYQTILAEALNEEDEENSEEEVPSEDEQSEEESEEESEEDSEDQPEEMEDEEKQEAQEALVSFLNASQYLIQEDIEKPGIIINKNNAHFYAIRESILDQIVANSVTADDAVILESIVSQYEKLLLKEKGVEMSEAAGQNVFKHGIDAISGLVKKYGATVTAPFSKAGAKKVARAGEYRGRQIAAQTKVAMNKPLDKLTARDKKMMSLMNNPKAITKEITSAEGRAKAAQIGKSAAAVGVPAGALAVGGVAVKKATDKNKEAKKQIEAK